MQNDMLRLCNDKINTTYINALTRFYAVTCHLLLNVGYFRSLRELFFFPLWQCTTFIVFLSIVLNHAGHKILLYYRRIQLTAFFHSFQLTYICFRFYVKSFLIKKDESQLMNHLFLPAKLLKELAIYMYLFISPEICNVSPSTTLIFKCP